MTALWLTLTWWSGVTVGVVVTIALVSLREPEMTDERRALREAERILHVERVR